MEKTFDCLKMKAKLQAQVYEETKDMSSSEAVAYFHKHALESGFWRKSEKRGGTRQKKAAAPAVSNH